MRKLKLMLGLGLALSSAAAGAASVDVFNSKAAFDANVSGAASLTGPLSELGNVGNSVTIGGATLTAGGDIFVEEGWSSKFSEGDDDPSYAIAISGPENLNIDVNLSLADAFGFFFHEPTTSNQKLDGCNATCVASTFNIRFFNNADEIGVLDFIPSTYSAIDERIFFGWRSDERFNRVEITETTGGIDNEFYGEMFARVVPLPAAVWLFGSALIGLGLWGRMRR